MKKYLLIKSILTTSILNLIITVGTASANVNDLKFYAGAGLDYIKYTADGASTIGAGISAPVLGIKFCDNFSLEAGYGFNTKLKGPKKSSLKVNNVYTDAIGFMPIANQVDIVAGLGMGRLMVKKGSNIPNDIEIKNKFNWRLKLGAQYNINNFGIRALFTYQNVKNKIKDSKEECKFINNTKSLGLSAIWTF